MPIGSNILSGAAAQSTADLGEEIKHSLRFNAAGFLKRAQSSSGDGLLANDRTFTFSTWFKLGKIGETQIFGIHPNGSDNWLLAYTNFSPNPSFAGRDASNGWMKYSSTSAFRDPSAWYHLFLTCSNGVLSLRVNNVLQDQTSTQNHSMDRDFIIGAESGAGGTPMTGYLAETYFFQGSVLNAVDNHFIRVNRDGVIVPDTPTNTNGTAFTASDYGTNGWHLTYDPAGKSGQTGDGAGIGADHSPNNNHFTPSGFVTTEIRLWSNDLSLDANSTESSTHVFERAFDNNTSTVATNNEATGSFTFNPNPAINFSSSVKVRVNDAGGSPTATIGSTSVNLTANSLTTVVSGSGSFGAGGDALVIANTGSNPQLCQIEVDGTVLVNNTDNDIDFEDTPTKNYAVGNPLHRPSSSSNLAPSFAHLGNNQSSGGTMGGLQPTFPWDANENVFFEVKVSNYPLNSHFGFNGNPGPQAQTGTTDATSAKGVINWSMNGGSALGTMSALSGPFTGLTWSPNYTVQNDVVAGWEWDGPNRRIKYYEDGELKSTSSQWAAGSFDTANFFFGYNASPTTNWKYNFGQQNFISKPSASKALNTNNIDEPKIKNGSDHFAAVTYNGNGGNTQTISLDFKPDLIWIKARDAQSSHCLYDTVRGATAMLNPDDDHNERTDGNVASVSSGFTVGALNTVTGSTNINNIKYSAWCWKAGGATVANTAGDINSQVSVNSKAGFSIVSYTGNNTVSQTVGHGLSKAPEVIILKNRERDNSSWIFFHSIVPASTTVQSGAALHPTMVLDGSGTAAVDTEDTLWNSTSSTFRVRPTGSTNGNWCNNADDFIAYCWHSVEGYSKFGSYTGQGQSDGPFVYTGFKPAFVMVKTYSGSNGSWSMYDNARVTINPNTNTLVADGNATQVTSGNDMDFLSNGFKPRDNGSINNNNGDTYLYMAFAEYPFGGENAPPAPAV